MTDRSLIAPFLASIFALLVALPALGAPPASEARRVADPITHENLAIYFIKGRSETGPVPLTLDEALEKGGVKVHETQQVSELEIENTGEEAVLVHAGDIVKGGQQDRVLTVTILVPPKSGRVPISSYCVERGRWSARGNEEVATFASSKTFMPSLEGKRAMRIAQKTEVAAASAPVVTGSVDEQSASLPVQTLDADRLNNRGNTLPHAGQPVAPDAQGEVWRNVARMQSALGANLDSEVAAAASPTSLQLALENEKLAKAQAAYVDALKPRGESEGEVIGLVIAVNGELKSADIYPSNALFRKFWTKHLNAAATEAIARRDDTKAAEPAKADVEAFLKDAETGKKHEQALNDALSLEVTDGEKTEAFASRMKGGALLHMNLLKK
ncbi:DUF6569 family protein [Hyphomicrobium sp.]|uniref:ARPP-1 family domain-containing protein n=1 Tax=Hyphomicrobium sp. TaxID=82 RepID=UPI0025C1CB46|nr:DUF6569 family protein [Hyphomicrobium sp.]MCC7252608.1 hypothetical protein [Hyphomicrobium sp.]